jgi:hypothetical protein
LTLFLAGCSGGDDFGLVDGYGTITLDGKPLAGARVVFERRGAYSTSATRGRTDAGGKYILRLVDRYKGTVKGRQTVRITLADDAGEEPIPARYNKNSKLIVEVVEGGAPYDFDLTSEPDQEGDVVRGEMHGGSPGGFGAGGGFDPFAIFDRLDENGDGKLTDGELSGRIQDRVELLDKNGDGAISREEFETGMQGMSSGGRS